MAEAALTGLSSMATRGLLAELAAVYDHPVAIEATGGVDAARRVRAGEAVDLVILADDVMCALAAEGHIRPGTITGIAVSSIAVAVRDGEPLPSLADGPALRQAVSAALRIGYSTGPSGDHVLHLLEAWNLRHELGDRLVRARPGIPVGQLLAQGDVDLAFQQSSELMGVPGIVIAGHAAAGRRQGHAVRRRHRPQRHLARRRTCLHHLRHLGRCHRRQAPPRHDSPLRSKERP